MPNVWYACSTSILHCEIHTCLGPFPLMIEVESQRQTLPPNDIWANLSERQPPILIYTPLDLAVGTIL